MKRVGTYIVFLMVGAAIAVGAMLLCGDKEEVKYARMGEVFENSNLKQSYEKKLKDFEQEAQKDLETIQNELELSTIDGDASKSNQLRAALQRKEEEFSQEYHRRSDEFQKVIWEEINTKIETFGNAKGYKYILGANGNGSIMYANDGDDITQELIEYLNADV